jgi:chitin deacetylase
VQVPVGDKSVALTFDDGPSPYTREILRILKDRDVRATFFMVGQQLRLDPQDGLAVRDAGHVIGNHSYTHPAHPHRPRFEVLHTDSLIEEILQVHPQLYRPPYGRLHNGMDRQARQDNKAIILWSVDPQDWRRPAAARLVRIVLRQVRPGAIILLHDGGGDRSETVAALPDIIKTLQQRDYRFVTVPELLNLQRHIPHRVS